MIVPIDSPKEVTYTPATHSSTCPSTSNACSHTRIRASQLPPVISEHPLHISELGLGRLRRKACFVGVVWIHHTHCARNTLARMHLSSYTGLYTRETHAKTRKNTNLSHFTRCPKVITALIVRDNRLTLRGKTSKEAPCPRCPASSRPSQSTDHKGDALDRACKVCM